MLSAPPAQVRVGVILLRSGNRVGTVKVRPFSDESRCWPDRQGRANCGGSGGANLGLLVQSRRLESPAGDLIVVPGAVAENVALKSDAELPIDRAGGNCNVVVAVAFPEQHRTALLAESAPSRIA